MGNRFHCSLFADNFVLPQAEEIVRQPPPAPSSPSITTPNVTDPVKIETQNTEPEVDADFQESIKGELCVGFGFFKNGYDELRRQDVKR